MRRALLALALYALHALAPGAAPALAQPPAGASLAVPTDTSTVALLMAIDQALRARRFEALDAATQLAVTRAVGERRYSDAIALLRTAAERVGGDVQRALVRTLADAGREAEAEVEAQRAAADPARATAVATTLGALLARTGRPDDARRQFERAIAGRAPDTLTARVGLAALLAARGARDSARTQWRRVATAVTSGARLSADDWLAVGDAQRGLAREEPQRFRLALQAYDRAAAENPADPEPKLRAGELFLAKYNATDARKSFETVLRTNPRDARALLGLARVREFDGAGGALALAESSLAVNPRLVAAHLFVAAARLDAEDYAGAQAAVTRALLLDSASLDALTLLGAVRYLSGDVAGMERARARVLARDPMHAEFYAELAELAARHRQYAAAARLAEQGVALDRTSWRGWALRGINQLRLGHVDSARASLEAAFAGDPFDVWTKNTLDLLDATKSYRTTRTAHFEIVADSGESTLLSMYLGELLEDAWQKLATRYGYRPAGPVRLEVYRTHADFSVRSVGLTGLGALGISFGPVLAMDAPSARDVGAFHWGATAWHELAHTFTLGVTNDRVPRWLSEGLSVLEERRARPGWGDGPTPSFLGAYAAGRVPPPSRLNEGFVRPAFPEQVIFSYYAASLLCELIERDFGAGAMTTLLAAYKDGLDTPAAVQRALKLDLPALDARFDAYVRQRFGPAIAAVAGGAESPYKSRLDSAEAYAERPDSALPVLERARASFPEWAGGEENAYWRIAAIHEARGDVRRAAAALEQLTTQNAGHYQAQLKLATLREQLGDTAGAARALEQSVWISPYDPAVHAKLATFAARLGDRARAVRERRAVLALAPTDVVDARFQLARALYDAGERAEAKREVLRALERAPGYAPAQDLLLLLVDGGGR